MNIRSESEVISKLESFEDIDGELKIEILSFFKSINVVLPDSNFIDFYLDNLSSTKGYSYNALYLKLSKRVKDKSLLKDKLTKFFSINAEEQIQNFIQKNFKKLSRFEDSRKRIQFLVNKGFRFDISKKYLQNNNL